MSACLERSICIVPLIGLPAAGKTQFSHRLRDHLEQKGVCCLHVCYDQLVPLTVQRELRLEPGTWKRERELILAAVDRVLVGAGGEYGDNGDNDEDAEGGEDDNKYFHLLPSLSDGRPAVVLVDDNNYLQSMRQEYHQLARKHRTGFAQLYFSCDTQTAIRRNSERPEDERVPSQVIETMAAKLEPPNPLANRWETFSFTLGTGESQHNLELVLAVIEAAASSPVTRDVAGPSEEQRQQDRIVCSASLVHQADRHLRSLVNRKMLDMKQSGLSKEEMNMKSKSIYSIKTEVLEDLKTGWTKLDRELIQSVENREAESGLKLERQMEELFEVKLKIVS